MTAKQANSSRWWVLTAVAAVSTLCLCYGLIQVRQAGRANNQVKQNLLEARRQSSIGRQFIEAFEQLQPADAEVTPARVRWADRLATALQGTSARFQIENPELLASVSAGGSTVTQVWQYPVRIKATLTQDAELIALLSRLNTYSGQLLENRACDIDSDAGQGTLRLNCLYVFYEFEVAHG